MLFNFDLEPSHPINPGKILLSKEHIRDHDIRPLDNSSDNPLMTSLTSKEGALNNLILLTNVGQCMFEQGKIIHPLKCKF